MSKRAKEFSIEYADRQLAIVDKELSETNYHRYTKMGVHIFNGSDIEEAAMVGYEQAEKDLGWHSVKESLPPIEEQVIVLTDDINGKIVPGAQMICYGHRPNPKGWDGKNIGTGEVTHYTPKTFDGWNIPGVTHWMYCPKLEEE